MRIGEGDRPQFPLHYRASGWTNRRHEAIVLRRGGDADPSEFQLLRQCAPATDSGARVCFCSAYRVVTQNREFDWPVQQRISDS